MSTINKPIARRRREKKAATAAPGIDRQFGEALETFTPTSNYGARPYDGEPEFGTVEDAMRFFPFIRRTSLYELIDQGAIRSAQLRISGKHSGKRVIHLPSLRDYLQAQMRGGS